MNIVKNDNSAKIYLQIQCTPNQNPHPFFKETEKEQYSTLRMEPQKNHVQPKILNKKNNARQIKVSDFKIYYRVIKTIYWHKTDM